MAYSSSMINYAPPQSDKDQGRSPVSIGDAKESYHIGWIDEHGFYVRSSEGRLVRVSAAQLLSIGDHIDLIRLVRMEKEMNQNSTD